MTLLIARQMTTELEYLDPAIDYSVVPPLCPLVGSPYDFSRTAEHIDRAIKSTGTWIADGGLVKAISRVSCALIVIEEASADAYRLAKHDLRQDVQSLCILRGFSGMTPGL